MLELRHVDKSYLVDNQPFYALKDINLLFSNVQFVSILGPSGCGKTTLLNLIGGLDDFDSGEIISDGKNLKEFTEKDRNSYRNNQIGFIFQNSYLIPQLNVLENVEIALSVRDYSKEDTHKLALEALKAVHAEKLIKKKPNQLSGGQQQRIAIARALVTSPSYVLADEPTGALDSESSREIMELLKGISKDRLVIMVTHNEELANEYSDRIIRMNDGQILEDNTINSENNLKEKKKEEKASHLSFSMTVRLAFRNLFSRKAKTILTAVANSFGMIGIAFLLAINHGFDAYSTSLSNSSATSMPIVISAYNKNTSTEKFNEVNASESYPDSQEIYPSVSTSSQYSYSYNNFSSKYLSFLNTLKDENIVKDYTLSYSNSYSFNLMTDYPASINGKNEAYFGEVDTTITNYNYYAYSANLPYNIFHVLYGDMDQYDLISGSLPETENDLVLVVNQYNAVSFKILKALGFYNSLDTEDDVKDSTLKSKVKPISFNDVIGKEYHIFDNDEIYPTYTTRTVTDALGKKRTVYTFDKVDVDQSFVSTHGRTLKITGIIRAKKDTAFTILSPALCYSSKLQDELMPKNENSQISTLISNNMVFTSPDTTTEDVGSSFIDDLETVLQEYYDSESSVLPTDKLNSVFNKYFVYYPVTTSKYLYTGFSAFFSQAMKLGSSLVDDAIKGIDLSKKENIEAQIASIKKNLVLNYDKAYSDIISLISYANAYSSIQCLVVFPTDLQARKTLLEKMDEYNNVESGKADHASNDSEKIYYTTNDASDMIEDVGTMISLVTIILIIFAVISMIASIAMTSLLISNNVLERKKEIGLLRSLGTKRSNVIFLFELESIIIGLTAGVIGSLFTYVLCFPLNSMLRSYLSYYRLGNICDFTIYHALIVTGISLAIGVVSALIPAYKASKVSPITSLRSE